LAVGASDPAVDWREAPEENWRWLSENNRQFISRSHRMTPLRQRMIEDMQLRNLTPATQRNYLHHVIGFAKYFNRSPAELDIEAVRQYQLYLLNERKLSAETINQYISSMRFLYLNTLEMPWTNEYFPHVRRPYKLPVVLSQEEILAFFDHVPGLKYRAALLITSLRELRLNYCRFTDKGLDYLRGLQSLERLELIRTRVTDAGLKPISELQNLAVLKLNYTAVTDKALELLRSLPKLRELALDSTEVTDSGVASLGSMAALKSLDLYHTLVSEKGFEQLRASLPGCRIVFDRDSLHRRGI